MDKYISTPSVRKALADNIDAVHNILDMEPFKYDDNVPYARSWIEQMY